MNKVIRYIKELEDETGKPLNRWAVFQEEQIKNGKSIFIDAKIVKTFETPYHARNWMEYDGKRTY